VAVAVWFNKQLKINHKAVAPIKRRSIKTETNGDDSTAQQYRSQPAISFW
jgi:hypothetical protein